MGMNETTKDLRRERGKVSRQSLIEAMILAVARHGLPGATLSAVADIAGVSRSLINFHFQQKEQLLDEALRYGLAAYESELRLALAAAGTSAMDKLKCHTRHDIDFVMRHPELLALWYAVWGDSNAMVRYRATTLSHDRGYREEYLGYFKGLAQDEKRIAHAAFILDAYIDGLWLECHLAPGELSAADAYAATDILIDALLLKLR